MSEVRLITPITRQSTKKMQVAAYCRVSSNSADQLNSYAAQIRAYKKLIGERDDWELVDIFDDDWFSGGGAVSANAFGKFDDGAGYLTLEWSKVEHFFLIEIEADPVVSSSKSTSS